MNNTDLEKLRDEVIEEIKRVFPVNAPPKALVKDRNEYHNKALLELFEGKKWIDLVDNPHISYMMNDVDFLRAIKERTFIYYFPAFLVTTLNDPYRIQFVNVFYEIVRIAAEFSVDKLHALIAYFTYQEKFWNGESRRRRKDKAKLYEDLALRLLVMVDEKKPNS